ncbi:MAG: hypothetical protein MN733_20390 [Nitrososphaera sp.]|nr:hypothetical protein [Nitrososphaera sp.]
MVSRKVTLYLVGMAAAIAMAGLYLSIAQATITEVGVEKTISYYAAAPQEVTIKKGEPQTILVDVFAPRDSAMTLKLYISEPGESLTSVREKFNEKFSEGISVEVDKRDLNLRAVDATDSSVDKRETLSMTVSADSSANSGPHTLALTLSDGQSFMTTFVNVIVE